MECAIRHFQGVKSRTPVVIWSAVSGRDKRHKENLEKQAKRIRKAVEKAGCIVLEIFTYVGPRYGIPKQFIRCAEFAKSHNAIIVGERSDRLARHKDFHSKLRPNLQATKEQFTRLCKRAGVPVYTIFDPKLTQSEIHRELRKCRKIYPKLRKHYPKYPNDNPGYKKRR